MSRMTLNEEEIFRVARGIPSPDIRSAYLKQACGQDGQLFERVVDLLKVTEEDDSFLEDSPVASAGTLPARPCEKPGDSIGPYKLLQKVGEGGFGVVYMAEQVKPIRRKVALKIIKPGMDTKEVVARFEAERQALALMDHPSIAKVLDGGSTESGRPYFVMELVKGIPLTQFCDENNLDIRQRLGLFCTVCRAIQHAHLKGVIHRDIKPSNVLVTLHDGAPVPKVIDFGVSKAISQQLTEKTMFTAYGQMIGTPQYMSPEQAEMSGLDIDTRSDVYSLGVLLYELLTGSTPLDPTNLKKTAYAELQRMIREEEPPRPSVRLSTLGEQSASVAAHRDSDPKRLGAFIRGELDWIVMKSLEKNRDRRYETANSLAEDVENVLNGDPVAACPPSFRYRCQKFVARHKVMLLTAGSIAAVLAVATIFSSVLAVRAIHAERRAQRLTVEARDAESRAMRNLKQLQDEQERLRESDRRLRAAKGDEALEHALLAALGGRYDEIQIHLEAAESYGVEPGRVALLRGLAEKEKGTNDVAIHYLEQAVEQIPESMAAKVLLADSLQLTGHRYPESLPLVEEYKQMSPQTPDDFLYAGYGFSRIDPDRAIEWLNHLHKEHNSSAVYSVLSRAYRSKAWRTYDPRDIDRLLEYANVARTTLPDSLPAARQHVRAHLLAADVYRLRNERAFAEQHLKTARRTANEMLKRELASPYSHQACAAIAMFENDLERAIKHAKIARENATHRDQRSDLASLLYHAGRLEETHQALKEARFSPYAGLFQPSIVVELDGVTQAVAAYNEWLSSKGNVSSVFIRFVHEQFCILGKHEEAKSRSREYLERCESTAIDDLFEKVVQEFACGYRNGEELVKAATNREQRIIAHELLGYRRLGEGKRTAAIREFELAANEGTPQWGMGIGNFEGKRSATLLKRLRSNPTWPNWIPKGESDEVTH